MARYQVYSPNPVWFDLAGVANTPNGKIQFYLIGTTDPKDTYNAFSGGSVNANPVPMDSSGRLNVPVWLDGDYSVVVYDEDDVVIDTFDLRSPTDNAAVVPVPGDDEYLGGDGTDFIPKTYRGMPDPTGLVGYVPVSDGETYVMTPLPEAPEAPTVPLENTSGHVKIGTVMIQWGTDTVPAAASAKTANKAVTFSEAFSATPYIVLPVNSSAGGSAPSGAIPTLAYTSLSTTGCTITANIPDDDSNSNWKLGNTTPFSYVAIGPCVAP
ncbi:hypothetical protein [Pseudoxanthomonas sp. CF125]|uniref:hypothetical protein n=1 Tax=Pseudoxanthomonas sp. CF125 TaxID=1855303 RepID=UPI000883BF6F|nr:hypothetical protein [Pseudoxanthomonas sp. CF125]SDQ41891.1 hypothetical protein SAMN05216569_1052 [Pseudoxanthomonas sp. CF125]